MPPNTNCPMGSPSLLNGDFYENIDRLKDFSWSVIYSAWKHNTTIIAREVKFSDFWLLNGVAIIISTLLTVLFYTAYMKAVLHIVYKLTENMKVTREFIIAFYLSAFAVTELWSVFMMLLPLDNEILRYIFLLAFLHFQLVCVVFTDKCDILQPLNKRNLDSGSLKLIFLAVTVFIFLFFPAVSMNPMECPSITSRFHHGLTFWLVLVQQLWAHTFMEAVDIYLECEEFVIYNGYKRVGKLMKIEGFGWIRRLDEYDNDCVLEI